MRRQDYTTIGTGPINQFIAAKLMAPEKRNAILETQPRDFGRQPRIIDDWVSRWNGRLAYVRPAAGGMVFVRYDFRIGSSELSRLLREKESTFVVAGDWFGMDGHLRIGTGGHAEELREGLNRIDRVFASIS